MASREVEPRVLLPCSNLVTVWGPQRLRLGQGAVMTLQHWSIAGGATSVVPVGLDSGRLVPVTVLGARRRWGKHRVLGVAAQWEPTNFQ